ncbi:Uncharacterised protein [uncultured archaeon]|nr:Uncharacterised protein [uncultured archaeon]
MAQETILQHWIFSQFVLPFLLMFFVVFAVLEKTKVLGDKKQINALVSFVIGLIFVGAAYQRGMTTNLILFLTVAVIVIFVLYVLIGFAFQGEIKIPEKSSVKVAIVVVAIIAVIIATLWAAGIQWQGVSDTFNFLFDSGWSGGFWTNAVFVLIIAIALAVVLWTGSKVKG